MSDNIGPIIGAGLSIIALGMTAKIAKDLVEGTAKQAGMKTTKPVNAGKTKTRYMSPSNQELYRKIWG